MPYIYRYTDRRDKKVKYIGIIKRDSNFPNRFYQHRNDDWFDNDKNWKIEYAYFGSVCDVEMLEGHLISACASDALYNKAKCNWGKSSFVKYDYKIDWKEYSPFDTYIGDASVEEMWALIQELEEKYCALECYITNRIDDAKRTLNNLEEEIRKRQRSCMLEWMNDNLVETFILCLKLEEKSNSKRIHDPDLYPYETIEELYFDYNNYAENDERERYCTFSNINDFIMELKKRKHFEHRVLLIEENDISNNETSYIGKYNYGYGIKYGLVLGYVIKGGKTHNFIKESNSPEELEQKIAEHVKERNEEYEKLKKWQNPCVKRLIRKAGGV